MSYRRNKEERAIERIIRGLMKLPENRRCLNCDHLGPRYVCTSFSTFVCTVCSGVHREFGHRVKSVLVATFTSEEVFALQDGGNERAREIYLETWDPTRNTQPNGSDIDRIRDFIKHVYVDKIFTRQRRIDKSGDKENFYERHSDERRGLSLREDLYERRSHERSSPRGRSDRNHRDYTDYKSNRNYSNDKDYSRYFEGSSPHSIYERFGSHRSRSAARFEIVDNRIRDDRYGRGRSESLKISKSDTTMSPEPQSREEKADPMPPEPQKTEPQRREEKADTMAPEPQKTEPQRREEKADPMAPEPQLMRKKANPPVLRPLKDIMHEISQINEAGNATKANKAKDADGAANHQKTALSDKLDSADVKRDEAASASGSIDFKNNLKTQTESASSIQTSTMQKTSTPPSVNSVEFLLSELSFVPVGNASASPNSPNTSSTTPVASITKPVASSVVPTASSSVASSTAPVTSSAAAATTESASTPKRLATRFAEIAAASSSVGNTRFAEIAAASSSVGNTQTHPFSSVDSVPRVAEEKKVQTTRQHQPSASLTENNSSTGPQGMPTFEVLFDQPWPSLPEQTSQEAPGNASADHSSQAVSKEAQNTISPGNASKSSGRKELPAELFTFTYPTNSAPMHNWQFHPPREMGYGMQYAPLPNVAAFPSAEKSRNPFDVEDDPRPVQGAMLPSTASVPGALPHMSPAGMQPGPSPFASGLPQESPSYGMYMAAGGYMGQQLLNNPPRQRLQGTGSFGGGSAFTSFNPSQQYPGGYLSNPALGASNSFPSAGGNPFA
ncbi:Arf-GAP domain-containing protein [Heracleum sosnowskyi]|uniref:Arf-GAP domain-containing protein n=1 Tax=Heracleum sosnowskyi TaxID=360622 RepID=A0AAD8N301_9APIA|nr:Arf-GAP domain-containing protein [Heracleum sosnowskyi]